MAAPTDLQSAESYFGGGAAPPPTVAAPQAPASPDDLQAAESYFSTGGLGAMPPQQGPAQDTLWSSLQSAGARILSKTGFGVQNAWGADPYDFAEQRQALVKAGMLDQYNSGHQTFVKAATESLLRNAIIVANLPSQALRAPGAAFAGIAAGSEALAQEIEGKTPNAAQSALAYPLKAVHELAEDPTYLFGLGVGDEAAATARGTGTVLAGREAENLASATKGRALGTLGEGEAGYYDAAPPTPENIQARADSASEAGIPTPQPAPPPDIHVLARRIDPDTFEQFDALAAERDQHRETVQALGAEREASPEAAEARAQIDTILGKVNGVTERLTKAAADRLADAQARLDDVLNRDTPEMAQARGALMDVDYQMRDLAPDVSDAYRRAADMAPQLAEAHDLGEAQLPGEQATRPLESATEPLEGQPQRVAPVAVQASAEAAGFAPGEDVLGEQKIGGSTEDSGAADGVGEQQEGVKATTPEGAVKTGQARYGDLKAVAGEGELRTRGLAESTEASAIEKGLTDTFGDLPTYRQLGNKGQFAQVVEHMDRDPVDAYDIAMGYKNPPKGVHPEAYYVGVLQRAEATGDIDKALMLSQHSKLVTSGTTMGQRLQLLSNIDKGSPIGMVKEVQAAREADLASRTDVQAAKRDTVSEIKKEVRAAASKKDAWESFVSSIRCS